MRTPEAIKRAQDKYRKSPKGNKIRHLYSLWAKYRLSKEQYEKLLRIQKGRCAICKTKPKGRLCVDHNHTTGVVRKLLCHKCNHLIGNARESVAILKATIKYLEKYVGNE